ncbi:MAG TPA: hypothetical protein DEV85_06170 [Vibrio sp.]|uniref:hypothetical protein n=1 Tax=Vibrio sp. TaxID=678 RepID=UPI000EBAA169|nr:hypothetical protein [Vibrio sp.]HCH01458.1 hypothetical protein [Vibrio sp.]
MSRNPKRGSARWAGVPIFIIESERYIQLKPLSHSLLYELAAQYNGYNNGYLSLTRNDLAIRGFSSTRSNQRAIDALVDACIITRTRQGGIAKGKGGKRTCNLYAVNWRPIDEKTDDPLDNGFSFKGGFQAWFTDASKKVALLSR